MSLHYVCANCGLVEADGSNGEWFFMDGTTYPDYWLCQRCKNDVQDIDESTLEDDRGSDTDTRERSVVGSWKGRRFMYEDRTTTSLKAELQQSIKSAPNVMEEHFACISDRIDLLTEIVRLRELVHTLIDEAIDLLTEIVRLRELVHTLIDEADVVVLERAGLKRLHEDM